MITAESLTRKYDKLTAVDSLTFNIDNGEIFGLLGPNGGGKTTTVRMLCCLISPTSGEASIRGLSITDSKEANEIRRIIGYVPDSPGLYDTLSAYSNLEFYGRMYGISDAGIRENIQKYLKMFDLWEKRDVPVGTFSKGMKQKVSLARSLVHDPEIIIMDEPTASLDPESALVIRNVILELKKAGKTIVLNTHNLDEAQRICDKIGILKKRLLSVLNPRDLGSFARKRIVVIELREVNETIIKKALDAGAKNVSVEGTTLNVEVTDPEIEVPGIVSSITSAGGRIKSVSEAETTLEDTYFRIMKGEENESS